MVRFINFRQVISKHPKFVSNKMHLSREMKITLSLNLQSHSILKLSQIFKKLEQVGVVQDFITKKYFSFPYESCSGFTNNIIQANYFFISPGNKSAESDAFSLINFKGKLYKLAESLLMTKLLFQ